MWDKKIIELGTVKENESLPFSFFHTGGINEVQVKPSCGCASVTWNQNTNKITGTVNVGRFPIHLKQNGAKEFQFIKTINVSYTENGVNKNDVLIIKAIMK